MIFTKDKNFYKTLITLSLPIALQNFITFLIGVADNIMVGSLGDAAVSGVFMGNQIQVLLQVFSGGIEGAILVISTQYWGKGESGQIKKIVAIGVRFAVIFSLAVTLISAIFPSFMISLFTKEQPIIDSGSQYLRILSISFVFFALTQAFISAMRSVENTKVGLYVSLTSLIINVTLNYILIYGKLGMPRLEVRGAAIATVISRVAEFVIILIYVTVIDKKLKFKIKDVMARDKELLLDFIKYGTPIILGQLVWATNMLANSAIMGRQNKEGVVAALSIANTLHNLTYVVMNGLSSAVGIITGKTIGEGKEKLMREYAKTVQVLFIILGFITGGVLQILKNPFISLYNVSADAVKYAKQFINIISITAIGTCYQAACIYGLVKSGGDTSFTLKNDAFFIFLVVIPSAIITTVLGFSPAVVFFCLKSDQLLKCITGAIKINRYNWMKNLTRGGTGQEKPA